MFACFHETCVYSCVFRPHSSLKTSTTCHDVIASRRRKEKWKIHVGKWLWRSKCAVETCDQFEIADGFTFMQCLQEQSANICDSWFTGTIPVVDNAQVQSWDCVIWGSPHIKAYIFCRWSAVLAWQVSTAMEMQCNRILAWLKSLQSLLPLYAVIRFWLKMVSYRADRHVYCILWLWLVCALDS